MSELAEVAVNLRGSRDDCESASEMVMSIEHWGIFHD